MTTKIIGTSGIEFPDSSVQGSAADAGPAFRVAAVGTQAVTDNLFTKVTILGTEVFDTNNNFAGGRFTPTVAGYYSVTGIIAGLASAALSSVAAGIYKNGSPDIAVSVTSSTTVQQAVVTDLVFLNGSTDYVELFGRVAGGTSGQTITNAHFMAHLARRASA